MRLSMGMISALKEQQMEATSYMDHSLRFFIQAVAADHGQRPGLAKMRSRVKSVLSLLLEQNQLEQVVRALTAMTGLSYFLPEQYAKFQPVVMEAMVFLLKEMPLERLAEKIVDQLLLSPEAQPAVRMCALVKDMPCIQKLGQVICRSPGLDPIFKQALVDLEDNLKTVDFHQIRPGIVRELKGLPAGNRLIAQGRILAEASVCAVVPAEMIPQGERAAVPAVIKVVKPKVRKNLAADLKLLTRLAAFLDQHKAAWGLREFNFAGTLQQVRRLLENEIDLSAEQINLTTAAEYHRKNKHLIVPALLPVSTPQMTVMSREDGCKITAVEQLNPKQRRLLAEALTKTCILSPLQDLGEISIFHGDPHAGNIAYRFTEDRPQIIFYDWAMLGRLSRLERFLMVLLSFGLLFSSKRAVFFAADLITQGQISKDDQVEKEVLDVIDKVFQQNKGGAKGLFGSIEAFFEELTYMGIVFSNDLMMYEKAAVTLKGVLADIDPDFDRNDYLIWAGMAAFLSDLTHLRIHRVILEEIWAYYRSRSGRLLELQKEIGVLFMRACWHWMKRPVQFMGGRSFVNN